MLLSPNSKLGWWICKTAILRWSMSRKLKVESEFHRQTQIGCNKLIWLAVLDTSSPDFLRENTKRIRGMFTSRGCVFSWHNSYYEMHWIFYPMGSLLTSGPPVNMRNINRSSDYQNPISTNKTKLVKNLLSSVIAWNLESRNRRSLLKLN